MAAFFLPVTNPSGMNVCKSTFAELNILLQPYFMPAIVKPCLISVSKKSKIP